MRMGVPTGSDIEMNLRRALARAVRRQRDSLGLTLEQAAHEAGLHWRHRQKVEAGEVNVTLRTLARIAGALGIKPYELVK